MDSDSGHYSGAGLLQLQLQKSPFTNQLILMEIVKHLPLKYNLQARSVNKLWYEIFSKEVRLHFKNQIDFSEFIRFQTEKNEDINLGMVYKNFSFEYYRRLHSETEENLLLFSQLTTFARVKELSLPRIDSLKMLKSIIKSISDSVEYLRIEMPFVDLEDESIPLFYLPKLKHFGFYGRIVKTRQMKEEKLINPNLNIINNFGFIKDLLQAAQDSLEQITFQVSNEDIILSVLNVLIELKGMKVLVPSLKRINLNKIETLLSNDGFNIVTHKMLKVVQEFYLSFINFNGVILNSSNFSVFIRIYAIYKSSLKNLQERPKDYAKFKLTTVKSIDHSMWEISFDKLLFHFPRLKKLSVVDFKNSIAKIKPGVFNEMENLIFIPGPNMNKTVCTKLTEMAEYFPNLTRLDLKIIRCTENDIKIWPIFPKLTKLKELRYINLSPNSKITDYELTGISEGRLDYLRNLSYEHLRYLNSNQFDMDPVRISVLEELRKVELVVGNGPSKISLFFGFRLLPNLEDLRIYNFNHNFKDPSARYLSIQNDTWRILKENFPRLEVLKLDIDHKNLNKLPAYEQMKEQRPLLDISFYPKIFKLNYEDENRREINEQELVFSEEEEEESEIEDDDKTDFEDD